MLDRIVFGNKYVLCTEYQLSMKRLKEFLDQQYFIENELAVVTKHLKIGAQVLVLEISSERKFQSRKSLVTSNCFYGSGNSPRILKISSVRNIPCMLHCLL